MNAESLSTHLEMVISGLVKLSIFSVWKPSHYLYQHRLRGRFPDLSISERIRGNREKNNKKKTKLLKQK